MSNRCLKRTGKCFICGHVRETLKDKRCGAKYEDDSTEFERAFEIMLGIVAILGLILLAAKLCGVVQWW